MLLIMNFIRARRKRGRRINVFAYLALLSLELSVIKSYCHYLYYNISSAIRVLNRLWISWWYLFCVIICSFPYLKKSPFYRDLEIILQTILDLNDKLLAKCGLCVWRKKTWLWIWSLDSNPYLKFRFKCFKWN